MPIEGPPSESTWVNSREQDSVEASNVLPNTTIAQIRNIFSPTAPKVSLYIRLSVCSTSLPSGRRP